MDVLKLKESSARSSLAKKHGEGRLPAKENSESTRNCALSGGHFHSSTLSTPIKTYYGLQASSQTPASKLAFISASGHKQQQPIGAGQKACEEDFVITRTPLRLLAANNKNTSLLSPSPLERLGSPAFLGKARRVFVMPPALLSTPRRVPVKQKSSETTKAIWQSPYFTPKKPPFATPTSNKALETACQKNDGHHHDAFQRKEDLSELHRRVLACTPRRTPLSTFSRAGHVLDATCQKHDAKVENSSFPKRMLAFTHPQPPCTTPISSRKDTSASTKDGIASDSISKQRCITVLRDDDMRLDRLALLERLLATTPARRVPVRQKPKEPSKKVLSQHNEKKSSRSSSETPKVCKTKVGTSGSERPKSTGKAKQRSDAGVDEEGMDTAKQECDDGVDEMHDAHEESTDEAKQECGDGVNNEISVGELKQHDASEQGTKQQFGDGDGVDELRVHESKECDPKGGTDHAREQSHDVVHEISVGVSIQHGDGAECTDNLNATKDVKRRRAIKDNSSAKVKHCNEKKPSRKLFPLVAPHGKADVNRCKGTKPSNKMAFSVTPIRSTNVKKCEEKKPKKKASSLEALQECKASQARVQTCQNHGMTSDERRIGADKGKHSKAA